jgi:hypothetical protein
MARVVHAVDVEIKDELDPSLARAVNMTEAEFKRLEKARDTFNSLMSKILAYPLSGWRAAVLSRRNCTAGSVFQAPSGRAKPPFSPSQSTWHADRPCGAVHKCFTETKSGVLLIVH